MLEWLLVSKGELKDCLIQQIRQHYNNLQKKQQKQQGKKYIYMNLYIFMYPDII